MTNEQDPMAILKLRMADILENKAKLAPISPIGKLSGADSAVLTAMTIAVDQFVDDVMMDITTASMEGLNATLMTIYKNGLPADAKPSGPFVELIQIVNKAGRDAANS